ncbi:EAL and HDOD domain-containing protein [Granulicella aggregans]|uniref:EAL and HDOD domain-containing protein n=1 Tax=Granulicella aggregans TaxID=474949 RepID=UPI0021E0CC35|nr:HDOD domain-containing protein [Granulicella aggregans]
MNLSLFTPSWRRKTEIDTTVAIDERVNVVKNRPATEAKKSEERRFIARQPILDRELAVCGYELLFRSGWENRFADDSDDATRKMIADGALYGFHDLTHGTATFVNCTRESLVNGLVTLLPRSTVLEILETIVADKEVIAACTRYKAMGYKLALDDFRINEGTRPLVHLADYVKVDFRLSDAKERRKIIELFRGRETVMIAEKVETAQEFETAKAEGFKLFQGYFFCMPTVFSKKRAPTNGINYLYLISALSQDHFDVAQLALLLKSEPALSYQLLRLVNSASFGAPQQIRSLQDALVLVGEVRFRKLMMNAIATETCRDRPRELLVDVLHRARFLELMAPFTRENPTEQYLFGLLSMMDVMLGMPVDELIHALPLRDEVKVAVAGAANSVSLGLNLYKHYRSADWAYCATQAKMLHISENDLSDLYRKSLILAEKSVNSVREKEALAS